MLSYFQFGMNCQCFSAARLTLLAYVDGKKLENSSVWKDRIIVASTCRRSMQFGCYIPWLWMANCVAVMTKMLPLFNFAISCYGNGAWKTSQCACALAGSRFWLVESTLFGDHVSLRLHREFSQKFYMFNQLPGTHYSDLNISCLKWCSLINCNWCVQLDISEILALKMEYFNVAYVCF